METSQEKKSQEKKKTDKITNKPRFLKMYICLFVYFGGGVAKKGSEVLVEKLERETETISSIRKKKKELDLLLTFTSL